MLQSKHLNGVVGGLAVVFFVVTVLGDAAVDVQTGSHANGLLQQAREPSRLSARSHRGQLTIPQAFAGLRVAPDIYRWMLGLYGSTATSRIGVTVAESADPSLERRVPCCSGHIGAMSSARNCTRMGGECCSRELTDYPNSGGMGLINPKKLKKSRMAYQGNCYQCYEFYTVCLVGN